MFYSLLWALAAGAQPRPIGFVEALSLPAIQNPQLSPDGTQVRFVMDAPDWKANRRIGHIYRIEVDGTDQVQLTFGERGESTPRWSPDGSQVAFVARRDGDEETQINVRHAAGGEARRLTTQPGAVSAIGWSRDGARILLPRTRCEDGGGKGEGAAAGRCVRVRGDELQAFSYLSELWVSDIHGREARQLTSNNRITESGVAIAPDNRNN